MRILVTVISGFIGFKIVQTQPQSGHQSLSFRRPEGGEAVREFAPAVGCGLNLPKIAVSTGSAGLPIGRLAMFDNFAISVSSGIARVVMGRQPAGPGLTADFQRMRMFAG